VQNTPFDIYQAVFFGFLGYLLVKLECEPAPLLLGFVLGPLMEEHFRRAMMIAEGDWTTFVSRPLSLGLLTCAALLVAAVSLPKIRRGREEAFQES